MVIVGKYREQEGCCETESQDGLTWNNVFCCKPVSTNNKLST